MKDPVQISLFHWVKNKIIGFNLDICVDERSFNIPAVKSFNTKSIHDDKIQSVNYTLEINTFLWKLQCQENNLFKYIGKILVYIGTSGGIQPVRAKRCLKYYEFSKPVVTSKIIIQTISVVSEPVLLICRSSS